MAFDNANAAYRDADIRKGEFRELARDIVARDREFRKFGRTVNTAGSIVQAMEAAYKLGLAHGSSQATAPLSQRPREAGPDEAVPWNTIPPRPRSAFASIMRYKWLVIERNVQVGAVQADEVRCYWDWGQDKKHGERFELARTFSVRTLAPLVRTGLLEPKPLKDAGDRVYAPTAKALATWDGAIADGQVRR